MSRVSADAVESSSITKNTYELIRGSLIKGEYAPGEQLKTSVLSRKFGVSLGVIREALSGLAAEGLVLAEAQRGFRVVGISVTDLAQLSEANIEIEALCLQRSMTIGGLDWEAKVASTYHKLSRTPASEDGEMLSEAYIAAYAAFRHALVAACDNAWLLRLRDILRVQTDRYHHACVKLGPKLHDPGRGCDELASAALAGETELAVHLLKDILAKNSNVLRILLEKAAKVSS